MTQQLLVAGGGIGGLAAAVAARRAGWEVRLFEQAGSFGEVGAGIQLGPNATRILREWNLLDGAFAAQAARPQALVARDAISGQVLARMPLGQAFAKRYGAPYLTAHRADLHATLLAAAREGGAMLHTGDRITSVEPRETEVNLRCASGRIAQGDALVGADGLWSAVRPHVLRTPVVPRDTSHVAWRALLKQSELPQALRSDAVTAWLGPHMHMVSYPVRGGEWLNLVCIGEGRLATPQEWDQPGGGGPGADLQAQLAPPARELLQAVRGWRAWTLHDQPPVRAAGQLAHGRIALLGDAAHPMLPYLAQGAGMAIEDARELERVLAVADGRILDVPTAFSRYALSRWRRCARVQARSLRNARIFHATGLLRWGRNVSLRIAGQRLLDVPWLYSG